MMMKSGKFFWEEKSSEYEDFEGFWTVLKGFDEEQKENMKYMASYMDL